MNPSYGCDWRQGWPTKERQYYSQNLTIIEYLHEYMAKKLDEEKGILQLNRLANDIKKIFSRLLLQQSSCRFLDWNRCWTGAPRAKGLAL